MSADPQHFLRAKHDRAGVEVKLNLFNDALLVRPGLRWREDLSTSSQSLTLRYFSSSPKVSHKKLGKSVCKEFVLLHNCEILQSDASLGIFGLKFKVQKVPETTNENARGEEEEEEKNKRKRKEGRER
jgi:hypothetical protein